MNGHSATVDGQSHKKRPGAAQPLQLMRLMSRRKPNVKAPTRRRSPHLQSFRGVQYFHEATSRGSEYVMLTTKSSHKIAKSSGRKKAYSNPIRELKLHSIIITNDPSEQKFWRHQPTSRCSTSRGKTSVMVHMQFSQF